MSRRVRVAAVAVTGAVLAALTAPVAARAQTGPPGSGIATVARAWTFDGGCARGVVIEARPNVASEDVFGDVLCVSGRVTWGQTDAGAWKLWVDVQEQPYPNLGPRLDGDQSWVRYTFLATAYPPCTVCSRLDPLAVVARRVGQTTATAVGGFDVLLYYGMDPASLDVTTLHLSYEYFPQYETLLPYGVEFQVTPTLVPEPGSLALLVFGALALVGRGSCGGGGRTPPHARECVRRR